MPECAFHDPACQIQAVAASAFADIAAAAAEAAAELLRATMTWWVTTPSVDPDSAAVQNLQQYTVPVALAVLVGSIFNQAIRMTISRKKDPTLNVGLGLIRYAVITTLGLSLLAVTLRAGDDFSAWLLSEAADQDFGARMGALLAPQVITNPFMLLVLGGLVMVLGGIQWVLAVMLPLAASGSINESTKVWFGPWPGSRR